MALIFRKEAVTRLPCFATPSPSSISFYPRCSKSMENLCAPVRRPYYHLNKASKTVAKTGPNIQIFVKRGETGRNRPRTQLVAQGISIANEITGTYRSGIRPDGLPLGFGLVTSRPSLIGRRPNTETRIARQRVCGRIVSPPKFRSLFRAEDAVKRANRSFSAPPFSFSIRRVLFHCINRATLETFSRNSLFSTAVSTPPRIRNAKNIKYSSSL